MPVNRIFKQYGVYLKGTLKNVYSNDKLIEIYSNDTQFKLNYDHLVIATGSTLNRFKSENRKDIKD